MKPASCPRLFEAEAIRDGRLAGAERASFARHTTVCPACRREVQALDQLAEGLRAISRDRAPTDELRTLRERTRLVAAFDATLTRPQDSSQDHSQDRLQDRSQDRSRGWRRALWPAAAAALVAGVLLFERTRLAPIIGASPGLVVQAGVAAVWSKRSDGNGDRVILDQGELRIHVDHSRHQAKLVVALPDGELEDTGTTFTVSASNGHTTRVAVHEGSVVLRVRGEPPVAIGAGAVWIPAPPPQAASAPTASPGDPGPTPTPTPSLKPSPNLSSKSSPARARSPIALRATVARSAGAPSPSDPGIAFRAAVAVLEVGANRDAAAAFARFLVEHPRDPRAEDAAYLRVIALERCGAAEETRRAAQAYVRLYPTGFRRTEIEKLSQSTPTPRTESVP